MNTSSIRTVVTLALVGVLVFTAGCSGLGNSDAGANATVESQATNMTNHSDDTAGTTVDESPNSTENETSTGDDGHSHDGHSHGDDGTENGTETTTASSAAASGVVTVAINGSELNLPERDGDGDGFGIAQSKEHTWVTNETDLTLAEALSRFDIEATASQMTVDGEQYSQQTDGTTLTYRVDGEPVDPDEYVLEDDDEIWVTATTAETNVSTPGSYIRAAQQHAHGDMTFVVDGTELNFSQDKYQSNHRYFHYENGGGETWHAHSVGITLEYALSSLAGINVNGDAIFYNGTTYKASEDGTSIDVTVNGESVDPAEYVLQDGDSVRVVVESEA